MNKMSNKMSSRKSSKMSKKMSEFDVPDDLFNPRHVREQSNEVPFIGDGYDINNKDFVAVNNTKVSVVSLSIEDEHLGIEVVLSSQSLDYVPRNCTHIIVGVTVSVPEDGILQRTSTATWTLQHPKAKVILIKNGAMVDPGNVTIVEYVLMPIEYVDLDALEKIEMRQSNRQGLNENISSRIDKLDKRIDEIRITKQLLLEEDQDTIDRAKEFCVDFKRSIQALCSSHVDEFRTDNWVWVTVVLLKQNARVEIRKKNAVRTLEKLNKKYMDYMTLMEGFKEEEVEIIYSDNDFRRACNAYDRLCCLLLFTENVDKQMIMNFFQYKNKCGEEFNYCVVDLNRVSPESIPGTEPTVAVIRTFENGECLAEDVMQEIQETVRNVAICNGKRIKAMSPPKRATLEVSCPGHYTAECPPTKRKWTCQSCMTTVYYGFDGQLYCVCGSAPASEFQFKCVDVDHDDPLDISPSWSNQLEKLIPLKEVNILILGQSGVGKSTWINSTTNYMIFETLEEAERSLHDNELLVAIPVRFSIADDNLETKEIRLGNDSDEVLVAGASATQTCKTYSIQFQNFIVNFIDTPGLGDVRGVEEDRNNLKKVLDYIRYIPMLHGICILLKPNETRISVLMSYCVKELLSNLHQSCSNNLLFCFTNSRSTFYKPGETMPILKQLLSDIGVTNLVMPERTFCLDNEAFKYLCCKSVRGISFTEDEQKSNKMSWKRSVEETQRLLKKVVELEPHRTEDTMSLNRARRIILSLTRPIADITQNIERNIETVRNQKLMVETSTASLADLRKTLSVPQVNLVAKELPYPRTVCTAEKCVKYITLTRSNVKETQYVQYCHEHCYLQNVVPETHPNKDLLQCAAMRGQSCRHCLCSWKTHMHIDYEQELVETESVVDAVLQEIKSKQNDADAKRDILAALETNINDLENEKKTIIQVCVQFAHFLKSNAIAAYNDVFGDYLDFLIQKEEVKQNKTESEESILEKMRANKAMFLEEKEIFETAAKEEIRHVPIESIPDLEKQLYDLPINGGQLRQIMEVAVKMEEKVAQYSVQPVRTHQQPKSQKHSQRVAQKSQNKNDGFFDRLKSFWYPKEKPEPETDSEDSSFDNYSEGKNKGMKEGRMEGMKEGMKKGMKKGRKEGKKEEKKEGKRKQKESWY